MFLLKDDKIMIYFPSNLGDQYCFFVDYGGPQGVYNLLHKLSKHVIILVYFIIKNLKQIKAF